MEINFWSRPMSIVGPESPQQRAYRLHTRIVEPMTLSHPRMAGQTRRTLKKGSTTRIIPDIKHDSLEQ
ncbi:hypothetical protein PILCRDRAFT_827082 [Piloderma croceum F 1598]|uniref:Uncharacterized protein n=1 Tax=Piloderma croceum (strain F 1598) TaxID=765440 RepID=A0A0C3BEB5_PILCF|nr:hypothetical protein PILCRDRAFT_827082 [Piloderma croceum F 1598]